jgi:hypothetical protein
MSNCYWKNLVDKSLGDSEFLTEYQQISKKIDYYYKNFSVKADLSSYIKPCESPKKSLTVSFNRKSRPKNSENLNPDKFSKESSVPGKLGRSPNHRRTHTMKERNTSLKKKTRTYFHQQSLM